MLQARQLGTELLVGVHSDEAILENKGPTVMRLDERCVMERRSATASADEDSGLWQSKPVGGPPAPFPVPRT